MTITLTKPINHAKYEMGKCPYCKSMDYTRENTDINDDCVFFDCSCINCARNFKETFTLAFQEWEE